MEGFLETSSSIYLVSFRKNYEKFVNESCNIFLKGVGFDTPTKMEINPSIETALPFSFCNLISGFIFFGEQFQHTLRNKNPSGTALSFYFPFIFFREGCRTHPKENEILPGNSLSFFQFYFFKRSCSEEPYTPYEIFRAAFFFFLRRRHE